MGGGDLFAINGDPSTGDVWAVGQDDTYHPLTLHLENSHFVKKPNINVDVYGTDVYAELYDISEYNSNDIWAVGYLNYLQDSMYHTKSLIMHYDGNSWTQHPSPTSPYDWLTGVTVIGHDNAWAVGSKYGDVDHPSIGFVSHWNGSTWSPEVTFPEGEYSSFEAITAASSNDLWASGYYRDGND